MKNTLVILVLIFTLLNTVLIISSKYVLDQKAASEIVELPDIPEKETVPEKKETVPEFVEVPIFREVSDLNSVYSDVLSHSQSVPFGNNYGRSTNVHETAHGIHSYIRNKNNSERVNGFYVLNGKAVVIEEPKVSITEFRNFVPENLKSNKWGTYFSKKGDWENQSLYIFDEWTAYILGGKSDVEDVLKNQYSGGKVNSVYGCLDFSIYSVILCMAVKELDPVYWEKNAQFKSFVIWQLKEANKTYLSGCKLEQFQFQSQELLLNELLTSDKAISIRKFMEEELESVWLNQKTFEALQYLMEYKGSYRTYSEFDKVYECLGSKKL